MRRKIIPYGTKLPVRFSEAERKLIREHTFYDTHFGDFAVVEGDSIRLDMSLDNIEELQGYVAAACNHCDNPKIEKALDPIFDRLEEFLEYYDDQAE